MRTWGWMSSGFFSLQENSIVLNGSVMFNATRIPNSAGDLYFDEGRERYKLCMCADGTLFRVQVKYPNMGCQTSDNPCRKAHWETGLESAASFYKNFIMSRTDTSAVALLVLFAKQDWYYRSLPLGQIYLHTCELLLLFCRFAKIIYIFKVHNTPIFNFILPIWQQLEGTVFAFCLTVQYFITNLVEGLYLLIIVPGSFVWHFL